jgi:hypothetical protein
MARTRKGEFLQKRGKGKGERGKGERGKGKGERGKELDFGKFLADATYSNRQGD